MAGCTNHGCIIEPNKKGMGTNGLCHCLDPLGKENARALASRIRELEQKVKSLDPVWKYRNDPVYRTRVDTLEYELYNERITPHELMEIAMLACMNYYSSVQRR